MPASPKASFPIPANESRRLEALRRFKIMDSEPEEFFDDLVEVAATVTGVQFAVMSLVDEERQWFKARYGLDITETPREHSICTHTVCGTQTLVVKDTAADARFRSNPYALGEGGIRFYAGAPIYDSDRNSIGTICVLGTEPRSIERSQIAALEALARSAMSQIELRHIADELAETSANLKVPRIHLPMCCHCKSIRDEGEEWRNVEDYFKVNSRARLTHGICPACLDEQHEKNGLAR